VCVDTPGRGKHRSFGFKTDDPETPHATTLGTSFCQGVQIGLDRGDAALECAKIHIRMAAGVDMADKPGLGPSLQLAQKAPDGNGGDGLCLINVRKPRLGRAALV
jgi:hypothetical protein